MHLYSFDIYVLVTDGVGAEVEGNPVPDTGLGAVGSSVGKILHCHQVIRITF